MTTRDNMGTATGSPESQADKKEAGKSAGATGWIVKPFDPDKLVRALHIVAG